MENITHYSEDELSLRVFNDELMYRHRNDIKWLKETILDEFFTYTPEQYNVLLQDIEDDQKEE
jgi:hypothetical protein